jgi:5-methylcytosine-specific restriction endonuclease McrA
MTKAAGRTLGMNADQYRKAHGREKGQCTWCGGPVPKSRQSWCGQSCVDEFNVRQNPGLARSMVFRRDRGVCAECHHDTERDRQELERIRAEVQAVWYGRDVYEARTIKLTGGTSFVDHGPHRVRPTPFQRELAGAFFLECLERLWLPRPAETPAELQLWGLGQRAGQHFWEADHIVPVVEGGGACGLSNLRTLCRACHGRATGQLRRRRAGVK